MSATKKRSLLKAIVHKTSAVVMITLVHIFSHIPLSWVKWIAKVWAFFIYHLPTRPRFLALSNLRAVYPELSEKELDQKLRETLWQNAQSMLELGGMWTWPERKVNAAIREIRNEQIMIDASESGKGVLVLTPHLGDWEMVGSYLGINYTSTFMYRPPNLQEIEKFMRKARMRFGSKLAPTDLGGVRQIIRTLKAGEVMLVLPDQDAGANGVHAPFMGHPARTMTLVSKLLQKTEAECIFMVALRHPEGGFVLDFFKADRDAMADKDPVIAATALNREVEKCIQMAPEQYLWTYRRFRGQPEGYPNIYAKK